MNKVSKIETTFEEAFDRLALSTWNRPRTNVELRSFVTRHHDALVDVELGL